MTHPSREGQALCLASQGKLEEAKSIFIDLVRDGSKSPFVYGNLAMIFGMQGNLDAALKFSRQALDLKPDYPEAHNIIGNIQKERGDLASAAGSYKAALAIRKDYPEAFNNLGVVLNELGNYDAAASAYRRALSMMPNYAEAHNNLGVTLQSNTQIKASIKSFQEALRCNPNYPEALVNLGNSFMQLGEHSAALNAYNQALRIRPELQGAQKTLAIAELLLGDYSKGWQRFEHRFDSDKDFMLHAIPSSSCTRWHGEVLYPYSKLLVISEQGIGDILQFMRYIIILRAKGYRVLFCAPPKLHTLIKESGIDISPITPKQAESISDGYWVPLLSVPGFVKVSSLNPIIDKPYITTTDPLESKWKHILSSHKRPIIGINWQGNPDAEKTSSRGRSLPLEAFAPIVSRSRVTLLSLQKGFGSEQLNHCKFRESFVTCQSRVDEAWDFLETAAIIKNCDLIITSDTAVAHLAGGIGMKTWLLLKNTPDWRWGLEGDTTFWYPGMRLFRKKLYQNWTEMMEYVASEVEQFVHNHSTAIDVGSR